VASSPGFLVNRVLMPYLLEAMLLVDEGVAAPAVDQAAEDFGMPMGPVALADWVGLDICLSVAEILAGHFGGSVPRSLRERVNVGKLGRKTGAGFYNYHKGRVLKERVENPDSPALQDRLILPLLNEAVRCLREGVVAEADLLDAGVIYGTGFAPFRGGPLHHIHARGAGNLKTRLDRLARTRGERFRPDPGWETLGGG
jgi:3-hydroxyacyl-CoA dehydrogenase/enoyl-CoA hydratase/3-hydroxybutyryl-CoA epimerase